MRCRIAGNNIVRALFIDQQVCRVLAPMIEVMAVAAHVVVEAIIHDRIVIGAVKADTESGVKRKGIFHDLKMIASRDEKTVHSLYTTIVAYGSAMDRVEVDSGAVSKPFTFFVMVE